MNDWTFPYRLIVELGLMLFLITMLGCATQQVSDGSVVKTYQSKVGDVLVLTNLPCTTMRGIFAGYPLESRKPELKAAKMVWQGKHYDACWLKSPDGEVIVVDETGDAGAITGSPFDPDVKGVMIRA